MPAHKPVIDGVKECSRCGPLPVAAFGKSSKAKDGLNSWCKACRTKDSKRWYKANPVKAKSARRKWKLATKYGISEEVYTALLASQNGGCAICSGGCSPRKHFDVDHCHSTGKVRGLLCRNCNNAIGLFADDTRAVERAVLYLFTTPDFTQVCSESAEPVFSADKIAALKCRYGISPALYKWFFVTQGGKCAVCDKPCKTGKLLSVDHCHDTGRVRGLLCRVCNMGLGKFKDNPYSIARIREYLTG